MNFGTNTKGACLYRMYACNVHMCTLHNTITASWSCAYQCYLTSCWLLFLCSRLHVIDNHNNNNNSHDCNNGTNTIDIQMIFNFVSYEFWKMDGNL